MAAILTILRTIKLERLVSFENQTYQTKAGKTLHNIISISSFFTGRKSKYFNVFLMDETTMKSCFTMLQN